MLKSSIDYQSSGYFSKIIIDYLNQDQALKFFYNKFPSIGNFESQIHEKIRNYSIDTRTELVKALKMQYATVKNTEKTYSQIELLQNTNTFTVTTGHQLNIFTGPIYFLYKIVSTINLCKKLKKTHPAFDFVPVYWMATEDHDFEEINYFNFKEKKIKWDIPSSGAVGRLETNSLENVFEVFSKELGVGENAEFLKELFNNAYLKNETLAGATRFLVNELFGKHGLVIIDGDDKTLKTLFKPIIKDELINRNSFKLVTKTIEKLIDYKIQVNPREINLFYLDYNLRERIVFENGLFKINNTDLVFSEIEILKLLDSNPEKFSPNVVLRPLYQEAILPNLCYVGGGGEIAYWLETITVFQKYNISFPILLLRNSAIVVTEKQLKQIKKLGVDWNQLFLSQIDLLDLKTKEFSEVKIDFSQQKQFLKNQFNDLYQIALQTDKSFFGAVSAQEKKQLNGLDTLEKRLLRAQKIKYKSILMQISKIQDELFPKQSLQERKVNFAEFYDKDFIKQLLEKFDPLTFEFSIVVTK